MNEHAISLERIVSPSRNLVALTGTAAATQDIFIDQIIHHGTVVQVIGRTAADNKRTVMTFDHRPFRRFWVDWCASGWPQPIRYDAAAHAVSFEGEPRR